MKIAHTKNFIKLSKTQESKLLDLMKDDKEIPLLDAVVKALNTRLSELTNANWNALDEYDRTFSTYLPHFFLKMWETGIKADNEKTLQVLIDNAITPSNLCKIGVCTRDTVMRSSEKLLILFAKSNAVDREGLCIKDDYPLAESLHLSGMKREASILLYYGALLSKRKDWNRVPALEKKHALRVGRMAQYLQRCLFTEESSSLIAKDDRIKRSISFEICEKIAECLYGPLDSEQRKIVAHLPSHNYLASFRIYPDTYCGSCMRRADQLESIWITDCCNTLICPADAENKRLCPRCNGRLDIRVGKIVEYRFS